MTISQLAGDFSAPERGNLFVFALLKN